MSSEDTFKKFLETVTKMLQQSAGGGNGGFSLDGIVKTMDDLWEVCKRTEMIRELKERAQKRGLRAKQWTPLVGSIDYMSVAERDMRMRFRNRVQGLRVCSMNALAYAEAPQNFANAMAKIEST